MADSNHTVLQSCAGIVSVLPMVAEAARQPAIMDNESRDRGLRHKRHTDTALAL